MRKAFGSYRMYGNRLGELSDYSHFPVLYLNCRLHAQWGGKPAWKACGGDTVGPGGEVGPGGTLGAWGQTCSCGWRGRR